jgi:hypothetical protein
LAFSQINHKSSRNAPAIDKLLLKLLLKHLVRYGGIEAAD